MAFPFLEYLTIMGVFFLGAISPGPDFAMVLRQSIINGRKAAIFTSFGIASAILVHATYTILGLGIIISQSLLLFSIVKYLGALYLLWLGFSALFAPAPKKQNIADKNKHQTQTMGKAFIIGFLTNLLNPKAMLFFISLFSIIVSVDTDIKFQIIYVLSMSIILFLWFLSVSLFFTTEKVSQAFYKLGKWFNKITGLALIFLAIKMAFFTSR